MNREQLEEIRARAQAAQSGRWICVVADDSDEPATAIGVYNQSEEWYVFEDSDVSVKDADFIASARADVPALLDEIDRLTRELDTMREVAQGNKRHVAYLMTEIERGVPVSLGTECLRCRHVYNWHSNANGWCAVVVDGQQCGCYFVAPTTAEGSAEGGTSKGSEVSP